MNDLLTVDQRSVDGRAAGRSGSLAFDPADRQAAVRTGRWAVGQVDSWAMRSGGPAVGRTGPQCGMDGRAVGGSGHRSGGRANGQAVVQTDGRAKGVRADSWEVH